MLIPFATQSYVSRSLPVSAQRVVNYFAEAQPPDAKTPVAIFNAPGIKGWCDGLAGAIRGMHAMGGVLYAVAGTRLYSVDSAGAETDLGGINTASGNVSMTVNRNDPQELVFVDGTDGWTYDTSNGLRQITDGDFQAADTVAFQDGYCIFNWKGKSRFFISNLNDGRSYTATDFADAEGDDDEVVAVFSDHRELWVFGERTIEVYFNSGATDFPFARMTNVFIERGCAAALSIAADDNTIFWLGNDGIVYRASGYTPLRISQHGIEEDIRKMSDTSDAFGFFFTSSGHKFYVLSFPTGRKTYVYDVSTGLWHERESFGQRYWRGNSYVNVYGKHLVGDAFAGKIGELDMDTYTEYGDIIQGILTSPPIHKDRKRLFHNSIEIDIESGVGLTSGADPEMWIDYSDDGGRTFSSRKPFLSMGKIGEYLKRLRWLALGQSRERIYRLTVSDPVKRTIIQANLEVEQGDS